VHSISEKVSTWRAQQISSAYMNLQLRVTGRSFVYRLNNVGARTDGRTDGHLRPTLLSRLAGVDLKMGHVTLTQPPFKSYLSSLCWDVTWPTCIQNLTTLASADLEIRKGIQNVDNGVVWGS